MSFSAEPDPWPHVPTFLRDAASTAPQPKPADSAGTFHPQLLPDVPPLQSAAPPESVEYEATATSAAGHAEPHQQQCTQGKSRSQQPNVQKQLPCKYEIKNNVPKVSEVFRNLKYKNSNLVNNLVNILQQHTLGESSSQQPQCT